jgi:hypothetical protein
LNHIVSYVNDLKNETYKLDDCEIVQKRLDIYYYEFAAAFILIISIVVALSVWGLFKLGKRLNLKKKDCLSDKPQQDTPESLEENRLERSKRRKSRRSADYNIQFEKDESNNDTQNISLVQNQTPSDKTVHNNCPHGHDTDPFKWNTKDMSQRQIEVMEFYRHLLINQIIKQQKYEDSSVTRFGNCMRRVVDGLFGGDQSPRPVDPQTMMLMSQCWCDDRILAAYARQNMIQNLFIKTSDDDYLPFNGPPRHKPYCKSNQKNQKTKTEDL